MHTRGVLLALLAPPISVIVTFLALGVSVLAVYAIADVRQTRTLPDEVTAQIIPRWSIGQWRAQRSAGKWRRLRLTALLGAGRHVVAGAVVGLMGTVFVLAPGHFVAMVNGQPDPLVYRSPLVGYAGAALGVALVVHAIGYTTSGRCGKFWSVAQFSLSVGTVGMVNRFGFLRRIWLYTWLRRCATAAIPLAVLVTISRLFTAAGPAPTSPSNTPEFTAEAGYELLVAAGFAVAFAAKALMERAVAVAMPDAHLAVIVHRCLDSEEHHRRPERIKRRAGIVDLLGERRALLARAARAFDEAAGRINLAFAQHPVASILRACGRYIRSFLAGSESLTGQFPRELTTMLNEVVIILAGPVDPRFPELVARKVNAFAHDDAADPARGANPKRWWASLAARAAAALDRTSRVSTAMWGLFILVVAVVLLLQGNLDLTKIQLQK